MMKCPAMLLAIGLLAAAVGASAQAPEGHPSFLPELGRDDVFPRFTTEQLKLNGYPDNQHSYFGPDWQTPVDDEGNPYGVGSICQGLTLLSPAGLASVPGRVTYGPFTLLYNQNYQPCHAAPFIELCDMALHMYADLLDLEPRGHLVITNPDKVADYRERTGNGTWRMFQLEGDDCTVQPIRVLANRTLIGHAAIDLVGQWMLWDLADGWPHWFVNGVGAYIGEMGTHFLSFMQPYRAEGEIRRTPDQIERVLSRGPNPDDGTDKMMFRTARYSAFLMIWQLVEHEGGLKPLRAMLKEVAEGCTPDEAAIEVYGRDLAALAAALDATRRAEPVGDAVSPRNPSRPPSRGPVKSGAAKRN